jgi:hypothetical protein
LDADTMESVTNNRPKFGINATVRANKRRALAIPTGIIYVK